MTIQGLGLEYDAVDSQYLDCLRDNLAVLIRHSGVEDVRTPFAWQWSFGFDENGDGMPALETVDVEDMIARQTGCVIDKRLLAPGSAASTAIDLVRENTPILLFGDAYFMPWLPYFGHEHMEHSFIVDGATDNGKMLHVVDAYFNKTEWGEATPTETCLPAVALERVLADIGTERQSCYWTLTRAETPPPVAVDELLSVNAKQMLQPGEGADAIRPFTRHYEARMTSAEDMKRFALACWLVARTRKLHGLWLNDIAADVSGPRLKSWANGEGVLRTGSEAAILSDLADVYDRDVCVPWQRTAEFAFLLSRRVSLGRTAPGTCFQMLDETVCDGERRTAMLLADVIGKRSVPELVETVR